MSELHFPQKKACSLFCDNKVISIFGNPVQHDRTKYLEIDRQFIKEKLEQIIRLPFVRLKDQLTDILTKAVTSEAFERTWCNLGIGDPKIYFEGE